MYLQVFLKLNDFFVHTSVTSFSADL